MREGVFQPCEKIVEPILDHEIYASEILPSHTAPNGETLLDVRLYAHELALDALVRVRGESGAGVSGDIPDSQEIAAARNIMQPYFSELRGKLTRAHYLHAARKNLEAEEPQDEASRNRAGFQHEMILDVWRHMQMVRLKAHQKIGSDVPSSLENGVVVVAPTGSGKTYIIAKTLQLCGIGRVLDDSLKPQSALVSVPSLDLIRQYASDDKRNIFRQVIGWDTPIAEYHGRSKEQAAVTLITHRSLQTATETEVIKSNDYDYIAFDEVHHSLAPKTLPAIRRLRAGLLGTTATPAYNAKKDVRRYFPHVDGGSAREFIESGILNPARLFSFAATSGEHAANMGATLATDWMSQGLRTIVYCEFGANQLQARRLAIHMNGILGENSVRAVGSYRGNTSDEDVELFRSGQLKGLTATNMLKEGFDDNVDAVILLGCRTSLVDISQIVGRALRRGSNISRIAEIIPPNVHRLDLKSIWDVFETEVIKQGALIGPVPQANVTSQGEGHVETQQKEAAGSHGLYIDKAMERYWNNDQANLDDIPEELQDLLLPNQSVRTALLAPEVIKQSELAPQGYILAEIVAAEFETTIAHAEALLRKAAIGVHKSWIQIGRERAHELWFAPDAREYFAKHPPLRVAHSDAMSSTQLVELTGLSRQFFVNTAKRLGLIPQEQLMTGSSQPALFYSPEDVARILDEVDGIPFADKADVPIGELSNMTSQHFVRKYISEPEKNIIPVSKRRYPGHGTKGIADHVTEDQAKEILAEYKLVSGHGRMNLTAIADNASVSLATVSKNLTSYERKQLRAQHGSGRGGQKTLPMHTAALVIDRLKRPDAPPPHLAPSNHMHQRFPEVPKTTYKRWLRQLDPEFEYVKITGMDVIPLCVRWGAYQQLEARFPVAPNSPAIDYRRLSRNPREFLDPEVLYGRAILDYYGLSLPEEDVMLFDALNALNITPFAAHVLTRPDEIFVKKSNDSDEDHISRETLRSLFRLTSKVGIPPHGYIAAHEAVVVFSSRFSRRSAAADAVKKAAGDTGIKKVFVRSTVSTMGDVYLEHEALKAVIERRAD